MSGISELSELNRHHWALSAVPREHLKMHSPRVRSRIPVGWVWGKAWAPISIWLECMVLGSSVNNPTASSSSGRNGD